MLFVSHVLPEVEQVCDRVAVLVGGKIRFAGPLAQLTGDTTLERALERYYQPLPLAA